MVYYKRNNLHNLSIMLGETKIINLIRANHSKKIRVMGQFFNADYISSKIKHSYD